MEETCTTEEVQMRSQAQKQGQQQHQGSHLQFLRHQNAGQKSFQGNQNYNKSICGSGYKSQYNKGNGQYHGNKPLYQENTNLSQLKHLYHSLELILA